MQIISAINIGLWFFYTVTLSGALISGNLYIKNDFSKLQQFECKYKIGQEERGPITVAPQQNVYLGPVEAVTDILVKRYGKYMSIGASYYSYTDQLAACKQSPAQNCILHIIPSMTKGWDVTTNVGEVPKRSKTVISEPIEYFTKAFQKGNNVEPRHVLDLGERYTAKQVDERERILREQIEHNNLGEALRENVLKILDTAAIDAKKLLSIADKAFPEYIKILLAFRGKLRPELVEQGRKTACDLFTGVNLPHMNQTAYLNTIIDLMWFYYDIAIDRNQAFSEGTFILQDMGNRIYNFLITYVTMVNQSALTTPALYANRTIALAYPRLSTHFIHNQEKYRQYGIDIRFTPDLNPQFLLPTKKSHLLFGKINDGLIYIKMENYGTSPDQIAQHSAELAQAKARKMLPSLSSYLQQYIPQTQELAEYYIGTDDDPNYRKEHIPQDVLKRCIEILRSAHLSDVQLLPILERFAQQGIHGIYNEINNSASAIPQAQKIELQRYLTELQVRDGLDHQDIRRGREVIITNNDLAARCIAALKF